MRKYAVCLICIFLLTLLTQAGNVQATGQDIPIDLGLLKKSEQGNTDAQY